MIKKIIEQFEDKKIMVIGDVMLDKFIYGKITRISPESHTPLFKEKYVQYYLGGAGNVARNLVEIGAKPYLFSAVGGDTEGKLIELGADFDCELDIYPGMETTVKTRYVNSGNYCLRTDRDMELQESQARPMGESTLEFLHKADALIISDYGKGIINKYIIQAIAEAQRLNPNIITVIDPKPKNYPLYWQIKADVLTPNLKEAKEIAGTYSNKPERVLGILAEKFDASPVVTLGSKGYIGDLRGTRFKSDAFNEDFVDVTGAGDTFTALMTLGLTCGLDLFRACQLGNLASAVSVSKMATATVNPKELIEGVEKYVEGEEMSRYWLADALPGPQVYAL